jgi:aminopeptidase N
MAHEREAICKRCTAAGGGLPFVLPGARPYYVPDRVCTVHHTRIEVALDFEQRAVAGLATHTLSPINDGPTRLVLDAVEMNIDSVSSKATALPFTHDGKQLTIDLGPRRTGETLDVTIRYRCAPRRGLYFIHPDRHYPDRPTQVWTQGQDEDNRFWFPCFDHPHEKSTSEVLATVPARMTALSNGRLLGVLGSPPQDGVGRDDGGATRTFHYRHDVPHSSYLVTLVAGEYVEMKETVDGVALSYFVYAGREEDARRSFSRTPEMISLFAKLTGQPYPYERYAQIVVAEFIFGGMENTSATTLTDTTLHDARTHIDFTSEPLVAHELAHQWFGDLLTCRDWSQGWLNEGFATYFEIVWREHAEGADAADYDRLADQEAYFDEDGDRYRRPIVTNLFHAPIDVFDRHLYEKGGAVLHMLRRQLGDARFWKAIAHYVARHKGRSVETRDLARAVDEATGVNVDRFFDQWVFKAGYPDLKVEYGWDDAAKLARVAVKQAQEVKESTPLFALPLAVRFVVNGEERDVELAVSQADETFLLPLPAKPTQAVIDPGNHLLKKLEAKKPDEVWQAELASARHAIDRIRAARAMGKSADPLMIPSLVTAMAEDPFWAVRGEAALALGKIRGEAAVAALTAAAPKEQHAKARRLIVRALGQFRHDERAAAAAAKVLEGDASYFVEAEAASSLAKTRDAGAFDKLARAMGRPSYLEVLRSACISGMAELRDERAVAVALAESAPGKPPTSRRAAIAALGLLGDEHHAHRRRALETLTELLDDPDFRARIAAVEALRVLGDPRAAGALSRAADADLDGRVRRRAREVARKLAEGAREEEKLSSLRDQLDTLREEADKLRERVLKLETK